MQHHAIGTRSRVFLIVTQEIALLLNFWFFFEIIFFQKEVGVLEISLALSFVLSQAQDKGARPLTSRKAPCGNEFAFPEKVDRKNEMRTLNISSILLSAPKRSACVLWLQNLAFFLHRESGLLLSLLCCCCWCLSEAPGERFALGDASWRWASSSKRGGSACAACGGRHALSGWCRE